MEIGEWRMSLCRLMVNDFMYGYGIWDSDLKKKTGSNRNYNRRNLEFGVLYAEDLLSEGFKKEPFFGYDLKKFIEWANDRMKMKIFKED